MLISHVIFNFLKKYGPKSTESLKNCTSEQIRQHFSLYYNLSNGKKETMERAKQFGCLTRNCQENTWKLHETFKIVTEPTDTCFAAIGLSESGVSIRLMNQIINLFSVLKLVEQNSKQSKIWTSQSSCFRNKQLYFQFTFFRSLFKKNIGSIRLKALWLMLGDTLDFS